MKLTIEINNKEIEISKEEALKLRGELNDMFGESHTEFIPYDRYKLGQPLRYWEPLWYWGKDNSPTYTIHTDTAFNEY